MADALKSQLTGADTMKLHALVVGAGEEGVALVGRDAASARSVRRGSVLSETVDGVRVEVAIAKVSALGVELETSGNGRKVVLPGTYTPLAAPADPPAEFLRYLESDRVPINVLTRLVADQTGVNVSASDACAEKTVSIFLRNVTADAAVEEICRATGLWFRREPGGNVIRITTMKEYTENLRSFREETTATFTLLYPNVIEVAAVIYGIYPDRTLLSLGEEEFNQDDEYELSRRFRRFRVLEENGNSQFMDMQAPRASASGSGTGSGIFSFSRGSALSRMTQWDQLHERFQRGLQREGGAVAADQALELESAYRRFGTNDYERAFSKLPGANANIFITMSRKNNLLVVRTSDVKVMDEIRRLVKELDVPTPMVLMEVKVLELDVTDGFNAKVEWDLLDFARTGDHEKPGLSSRGLGRYNNDDSIKNLVASTATGAQSAFDPTFKFMIMSDHVRSKIDMLQKDGKVKTLATPTLLTANNEVSRIFSGKEYPLVTGWTKGETVVSSMGPAVPSVPTVQLERKDVGTMLLVTPNINSDKTVTLRLLQENSEVAAQKVDIPVDGSNGETRAIEFVESRSMTGTFVAKDGMTVLAGGLIREQESETYWRTPVLGSIPYLGWLFRGTTKEKVRTELIVLIKPHVISTPMEGGKISAELMKKLSAHPARDGRASMGVFNDPKDVKPGSLKPHNLKDDLKSIVE